MNTFLENVQAAKALFNEYADLKNNYSLSPTTENEARKGDALAKTLRKILDIATEWHSKTESQTERNLLRQFAEQLIEIFK